VAIKEVKESFLQRASRSLKEGSIRQKVKDRRAAENHVANIKESMAEADAQRKKDSLKDVNSKKWKGTM
jgi:hypothetical protein